MTTAGAKTGNRTTSPLTYLDDGDRIVVFATNAGAQTDPLWYRNLLFQPRVVVEVGASTYEATAVPLHGEERDRMYTRQAALIPQFAEYEADTDRHIPAVPARHPGLGVSTPPERHHQRRPPSTAHGTGPHWRSHSSPS